MKLTIIYLGKIKELTGVSNEILDFVEGVSVQELIDQLTITYPHLAFESFQISVNRTLVEFRYRINEAADVALLPPFSGG